MTAFEMTTMTDSALKAPAKNAQQVRRVFVLTLALNLLVALSKLGWGFFSNSLSMVADGFHSLLDATSNIVGIVGLKIASKPADENHPYGHRKFEALSAMLISFFIFSTCFQILKEAIARLISGGQPEIMHVSWVSYAVMIGTLIINLAVTRYERAKGKELKSPLLLADAEHTQSDVFATLAVIASLLFVQFGYPMMDLVVALVMGVIVFRAGYQIIMLHLGALVDEAVLDPREIERVVLATPGVLSCHRIRTRGSSDQVFTDLHIQVRAEIALKEAHDISHLVENAIKKAFNGVETEQRVVDVLVHVEEEGDTDVEIGQEEK
ncbi:MAG: cation diffusion facilitator family transporter [Vampirovibrionales bacterium]|nr:cation diffusion facilitator family transporter [Vampirovibrionales bacterium]